MSHNWSMILPEIERSESIWAVTEVDVELPPVSLAFVRAVTPSMPDGSQMIERRSCADPGQEWIIPDCLVDSEGENTFIPILNTSESAIHLAAGERLALVTSYTHPRSKKKKKLVWHQLSLAKYLYRSHIGQPSEPILVLKKERRSTLY